MPVQYTKGLKLMLLNAMNDELVRLKALNESPEADALAIEVDYLLGDDSDDDLVSLLEDWAKALSATGFVDAKETLEVVVEFLHRFELMQKHFKAIEEAEYDAAQKTKQ